MEYRDGICALTRKESKGCVVLPAGVVFNNREVLLSDDGVKELEEILGNTEAHWQDCTCSITGEDSECVAIWGRLAPKRSIMLSKAGISALKQAISSRPKETTKPEPAKVAAPIPQPDVPISEEPKESAKAAEARVDREVAEMNLEEAKKALSDKSEDDDEVPLKAAVEEATRVLEEKKAAEEAAKA